MEEKQLEQTKSKQNPPFSLIRIGDTTISIPKITKIVLESEKNEVVVCVKDRGRAFRFPEETPQQAVSLFHAIGEIIVKSQDTIPFLFFANAIVRLRYINSVQVEHDRINMSIGASDSQMFYYDSVEESREAFESLMSRLFVGTNPSKDDTSHVEPTPDDPAQIVN